jgi:hypothetical protein
MFLFLNGVKGPRSSFQVEDAQVARTLEVHADLPWPWTGRGGGAPGMLKPRKVQSEGQKSKEGVRTIAGPPDLPGVMEIAASALHFVVGERSMDHLHPSTSPCWDPERNQSDPAEMRGTRDGGMPLIVGLTLGKGNSEHCCCQGRSGAFIYPTHTCLYLDTNLKRLKETIILV